MSVNSTAMEFDANADKALVEMKKLIEQNRALELSISQMAKASEAASRQSVDALRSQGVAVKAVATENDKLRATISSLRQENQTVTAAMKSQWSGVSSHLATLGIATTLAGFVNQQKEWNSKIAESTRLMDEQGRKLQVQGLLKDDQFQTVLKESIMPAVQKSATPMAAGLETATELVSQGFSVEEVTKSGALEELLLGAKAQNRMAGKEYATAIAAWLKSQGKDLTAENVRGVTAPLTSLFQTTAFQAPDLKEMAGIGSVMKNFKISQDETFAGITTLKDAAGLEPGEASTGLRNFWLRLGTAATDPQRLDTLRAIGGEKFEEKVDPVKVGSVQAMLNLKGALNKFDDSTQNAALANIFGQKSIQPAAALLSNIDKYQGMMNLQRDTSKFTTGVALATQGPAANDIRAGNVNTFLQAMQGKEAAKAKLERDLFDAAMTAQGRGGFTRALGNAAFWTGQQFGLTPSIFGTIGDKYAEGAPLAQRNLPQLAPGAIRKADEAAGPKKTIDFAGDSFTNDPLDQQIRKAQADKARLDLDVNRARVAAQAADSPSGVKISKAEERQIKALELLVAKADLQLKELELQRKEKPKKEVVRSLVNRVGQTE